MPSDHPFLTATASPSDSFRKNLWAVRLLTALAILSLILAQTIFKSSGMHDGCLGFGVGVLAVALVTSFRVGK